MNHKEMTRYLKMITIVLSLFLLFFTVWYLPTSLFFRLQLLRYTSWYLIFIFALVMFTMVFALLSLYQFWLICKRIEKEESFCEANAKGLKAMSQCMLFDTFLFIGIGVLHLIFPVPTVTELLGWALILLVPVCIILSIICASLSHLVQKASALQEEHDYTV